MIHDLADSYLRSIHAFRRNWEAQHRNFLLPKADSVFDYLEEEIESTYSEKEELGAKKWSEILQDQGKLEVTVQNTIAILDWVYWQRLEGYETADVSAVRECSFEDIGGIQQLFIAADALIEDYKSAFSFEIPYDILSVFGLHEKLQVPVPSHYFISVPRYAKYGVLPSWILFSHEIAHIAICQLDDMYRKWKILDFSDQFVRKEVLKKRKSGKKKQDISKIEEFNEKTTEFLMKILKKDLLSILDGESNREKLGNFFSIWHEIQLRAMDITELMIRLTSGSTGLRARHLSHEELAEQLICDIIATLLSGEYYIYSLCFHEFFPSIVRKGKRLGWSVSELFILRFFICLETLIHSAPKLTRSLDLLSSIYPPLIADHKIFGSALVEYMRDNNLLIPDESDFIKQLQDFNIKNISGYLLNYYSEKKKTDNHFQLYQVQRRMMVELLRELFREENSVKKHYLEVRRQHEEQDEMNGLRYFYMGSVLQEELRLLLKEGSPRLEKFGEGSSEEINSLERLIDLLQRFIIEDKGSFYRKDADLKEIKKIRELADRLRNERTLVLPSEGVRPTKIISAFCYLYFKEKLAKGKYRFEFSEAFNAAILSMAWSREALKRFSQ